MAAFLAGRFRGSAPDSAAWPCTGEVIVDLPMAAVRPYAGDGLAEPVGPARTRLVSGAWSWSALAASLLRFDADVEIVGPPELRAAFADLADRCARAAGRSPAGP